MQNIKKQNLKDFALNFLTVTEKSENKTKCFPSVMTALSMFIPNFQYPHKSLTSILDKSVEN